MKDGSLSDNKSDSEDMRITRMVLNKVKENENNSSWTDGIGLVYDGRSSLYSSKLLPFVDVRDASPYHEEDVEIPGGKYRVTCTYTSSVTYGSSVDWTNLNSQQLASLDIVLHEYARGEMANDDPNFFLKGSAVFKNIITMSKVLGECYTCYRGSHSTLKSCLAGLVFCTDMTVSCFLNGGPLINVMFEAAKYKNAEAMIDDIKKKGLSKKNQGLINDAIKGAMCKLVHVSHSKKIKCLGPIANSNESKFTLRAADGDTEITVADYYKRMCSDPLKKEQYIRYLGKSKCLKYPFLPTVNVGTNSKPILIPVELIQIRPGQSRAQALEKDPRKLSAMVEFSAIEPSERFNVLLDSTTGSVHTAKGDPSMKTFGLASISSQPMTVSAKLLPQAKLQFAKGETLDPGLKGSWNLEGRSIVKPPSNSQAGSYRFSVLICTESDTDRPDDTKINQFMTQLTNDCQKSGLRMIKEGTNIVQHDSEAKLRKAFEEIKKKGTHICVIVMMGNESYPYIKHASDMAGILTQCVKYKNILKSPRGINFNIALKLTAKLGGQDHSLISRMKSVGGSVYQDPPASISWILDKPCMFVGLDVTHSPKGSDHPSLAAIVASMDGRLSQFATHLSSQGEDNLEIIQQIEVGMDSLLESFKSKNDGKMPDTIIVYRDGVAESQFDQVLALELPGIRNALDHKGYPDVKISIIVCQKNHHTRLVFKKGSSDEYKSGDSLMNPCPGLCVDSTGGAKSIVSGKFIEFYLNSHAAILGTSKPCRYIMIHDEIGFKLSEIELLTYWTTYLYCRASKSVSYATPAYYAHWASKRAKHIFQGGGNAATLEQISNLWMSRGGQSPCMFFV